MDRSFVFWRWTDVWSRTTLTWPGKSLDIHSDARVLIKFAFRLSEIISCEKYTAVSQEKNASLLLLLFFFFFGFCASNSVNLLGPKRGSVKYRAFDVANIFTNRACVNEQCRVKRKKPQWSNVSLRFPVSPKRFEFCSVLVCSKKYFEEENPAPLFYLLSEFYRAL